MKHIAGMAAALLLLAGCGGDQDSVAQDAPVPQVPPSAAPTDTPTSTPSPFVEDSRPAVTPTVSGRTVSDLSPLVSATPDGTPANGLSEMPSISADGRFVAFSSSATDLLGPGNDRNKKTDVFVRDLEAGATTRVSVASDGTEADNSSEQPAISADGRWVVFASEAGNLVTGKKAGNLFLHDRDTRATTSLDMGSPVGCGKPAISGDGRWIVAACAGVVLYDRNSTTSSVVAPDGYAPTISADGSTVVYETAFEPEEATWENPEVDYLVAWDRETGEKAPLSVLPDGRPPRFGESDSPSISADGRWVAFQSTSPGLLGEGGGEPVDNRPVHLYIRDRRTGTTARMGQASVGTHPASVSPSISDDGRWIVFAPSTERGVWLRDLTERQDMRIDSGGKRRSYGPVISGNGRTVVYVTEIDTGTIAVFAYRRK